MTDPPTDPPDNVIRVRFKRTKEDLPAPPIHKAAATIGRPFCVTHFFEYDPDARTVTCPRCDRFFDPFEAFDLLARDWKNYDWNHRNVRGEIAELRATRTKLARQVTNLKAQRRRLVPNVRQDVERVRSELSRHAQEKNPEIKGAIMLTIRRRLEKVLFVLARFGDEDASACQKPVPSDVSHHDHPRNPTP